MKHIFFILLFVSKLLYSQGLHKSHHDFSDIYSNANEVCKPCHTPYNAIKENLISPLWIHKMTAPKYQMYTSYYMKGFAGQPTGNSKLCLSCHDGSYASNSHGGNNNIGEIIGIKNIILEWNNDHPISFIYDTSLAKEDKNLYDPNTAPSGLGNTIAIDLLENNRLECTSCHDVHLFRNTQGDCTGCHVIEQGKVISTITLSLWKSNDKSAFCFVCHKK